MVHCGNTCIITQELQLTDRIIDKGMTYGIPLRIPDRTGFMEEKEWLLFNVYKQRGRGKEFRSWAHHEQNSKGRG